MKETNRRIFVFRRLLVGADSPAHARDVLETPADRLERRRRIDVDLIKNLKVRRTRTSAMARATEVRHLRIVRNRTAKPRSPKRRTTGSCSPDNVDRLWEPLFLAVNGHL